MTPAKTNSVPVKQRHACSACGARTLEPLLELPNFPLTGIFVRPEERDHFSLFNQALLRCPTCGHAQLRNTISPDYLYQETYTHRSSLSPIATRGNDFLHAFIQRVAPNRRFKSIVEIGCNDLYLLRKLKTQGDYLLGFDPIWKGHTERIVDDIHVRDHYIEEINPARDIAVPPELIISANTLEHVDDPLHSMQPIFDHAAEGAVFVVEVPSFDTLVHTARYDQIFHQHLNYYSLASFQAMIRQLGGEYLTHCYNYEYWLGTMLIAFTKPASKKSASVVTSQAPSRDEFHLQMKLFKHQLENLATSMEHIRSRGTPLYGYGAAQMVPTLAYHLDSDLSFLEGILDDNTAKNGLTYPNLKVMIKSADTYPSYEEFGLVVTAPDSARAIIQRLTARRARYILYPFHLF
jgi:ribosomal protein L32